MSPDQVAHAPRGRSMSSALVGLIDDLFPRARDTALNADSARDWKPDRPNVYCRRCGASAGRGSTTDKGCARCIDSRPAWSDVTRLSQYGSPISTWIVAMKFQRQWTWGTWFGQQLAQVVRDGGGGGDTGDTVVCPVPMHWRRRWLRGYNQADLIARAFAKSLDLPCTSLLRRPKATPPQTQVVIADREANLRGAIAARPIDLKGCDVWLVDDVKTTGSTLNRCARALKQAGARRIRVAVAAVADPKNADFKIL